MKKADKEQVSGAKQSTIANFTKSLVPRCAVPPVTWPPPKGS
jgi:hypothetical protein